MLCLWPKLSHNVTTLDNDDIDISMSHVLLFPKIYNLTVFHTIKANRQKSIPCYHTITNNKNFYTSFYYCLQRQNRNRKAKLNKKTGFKQNLPARICYVNKYCTFLCLSHLIWGHCNVIIQEYVIKELIVKNNDFFTFPRLRYLDTRRIQIKA
jgi:hypothetical protein